ADLLVTFGSSINYYTVDGGKMYPKAEVVQIDIEPQGLNGGMKTADMYLRADAKLTAQALVKALRSRGKSKSAVRSAELARRIKEEPADASTYTVEPGLLDPRAVIAEIDRVIPKDWNCVSGAGHQSYFHSTMRGRKPENYYVIREFGAIGNGI